MRKLRKLGIFTLSTGLSIGILAPSVSAASPGNENDSNVQIQMAQSEKVVSKSELIKKFRDLFPQFTFLTDNDLHMGTGYQYPNDDTVRYDLSFHKKINGKYTHGTIGFIGDQLEIERFYYEPANAEDALFPAKITKVKAEEVAKAFLKKFPDSNGYQLDTSITDFFPGNQLLTEPIRYTFFFVKTENKVPISDQSIQITVLGNGEVTDFYRNSGSSGSPSYDDVSKVLSANEVIAKIKENLSVNLQYSIDTDFQTGEKRVNLIYQPAIHVAGIHALSGEWQTMNGFSPELPKEKKIEHIVSQPIGSKQTHYSLEEAKAFAENLLKIDSDEIKLRIESIDETKNYNGQEVISISYMYEYSNGGTGTNLELDKNTGEIIQYHDLRREVLEENGEDKKAGQAISSEEALNQAVKYLKQYSPSYLHNYSMPVGENYYDEDRETYHFSFPRVVNGILVNGEQISVSIGADGSLLGLDVSYSNIQNWPSAEKVISKDQANTKFFEQLSLDLNYTREGHSNKYNHYHLVYTPEYNNNSFSYLNAYTGEWNHSIENNQQTVSHPWAEKELNYLIQAGIIDVKDAKTFDANAKVTKGAALKVIMKSLTRFYDVYPGQKNTSQSFENIKSDHPLYQVVERAVTLGLLKKEGTTFNLDEHLTKEELAVWYIRILGLEQAAKNQGIYQLPFDDAKDIKNENIGYIALAHSLGILTTSDNKFNPKQEVSYADLAVSTIPLAHEAYKKGIEFNIY
ncbi:YcdB/YcdC domain-containing protein [Cytobacillus massiliigabonensis]|uniref:YcdB/YcdC domain-containing protein n=1 Tax=Cytobacillus massiliigabonensis TaxID=1871011 RepID=UPI000C8489AF|nr:YcdB/YcdC domain-containing protein [Cytobacillus massiliigabonensis]